MHPSYRQSPPESMLRWVRCLAAWCVSVLVLSPAWAQQPVEVALAGLAYAGSDGAIKARFPYSQAYAASQPDGAIYDGLFNAITAAAPARIKLLPRAQQMDLKGRDQALAVALVIGSETVVVEQFGGLHKLLVLIRAQAMFFDFKSMNVVRTYPLSFAYVDALDHAPTEDEKRARVKLVYEGANGKPGVLSRFVSNVAAASIPAHVPKFLQVTSAQIAADALETLPRYIRADAQSWLADMVGEAISTRIGVPIVPFAQGQAVGNVMSMRISDGKSLDLKLPQPDYEIKVDLTALKKIKFSEIAGGATSFIYGAYAQLSIEDALSRKFLNTALKNGETRVIPASQKEVDDFPHFYDAVNGLLTKLALSVAGQGDDKWIKSAAAAKDIGSQLAQTKEVMNQCK